MIDDAIDCASATIVVVDDGALIFNRCWPLYEMWTTLMGKGPEALWFTCPGGETDMGLQRTCAFKLGSTPVVFDPHSFPSPTATITDRHHQALPASRSCHPT